MFVPELKLLKDDALFHIPSGFNDPPCPLKRRDLRVQTGGYIFDIDNMTIRKRDGGVQLYITARDGCALQGEFRNRPEGMGDPALWNFPFDGRVEIFGIIPEEPVRLIRPCSDPVKIKKRKRASRSKAEKSAFSG